ncbi:MAG TPA: hypothetical protein VI670_03845 [Thermoanaerobaculia bacterium]
MTFLPHTPLRRETPGDDYRNRVNIFDADRDAAEDVRNVFITLTISVDDVVNAVDDVDDIVDEVRNAVDDVDEIRR